MRFLYIHKIIIAFRRHLFNSFVWVRNQQLRIYPQRFGVEVCKLMPKLKTQGEGMLETTHHGPPAYKLLCEYEMSDWSEAHLKEVVHYLYSNTSLNLPKEWKQAFPARL